MFRALLAHPQEVPTQTAFGILRAYNLSWLWHNCSETATRILLKTASSKLSQIRLVQTLCMSLRGVENANDTPVSTFSPSFSALFKVLLMLQRLSSALLKGGL
jgi:hypothetical protein